MNRLTNQELNNLIILLKSPNHEDLELALNILANPSFKIKRQLCQAVKFARMYVKHPYIICNYTILHDVAYPSSWRMSQRNKLARKCLEYLELYRDYDKRRIN